MSSLIRRFMRCLVFFFSSRRRHTRFKCDWSSDVCSSDLLTRTKAPCEEERAAASSLAFDPDATAHHLHQPGADCKTKPGAAMFARSRSVGLAEGLEDERLFLGWDADTGILHGEAQREPILHALL